MIAFEPPCLQWETREAPAAEGKAGSCLWNREAFWGKQNDEGIGLFFPSSIWISACLTETSSQLSKCLEHWSPVWTSAAMFTGPAGQTLERTLRKHWRWKTWDCVQTRTNQAAEAANSCSREVVSGPVDQWTSGPFRMDHTRHSGVVNGPHSGGVREPLQLVVRFLWCSFGACTSNCFVSLECNKIYEEDLCKLVLLTAERMFPTLHT